MYISAFINSDKIELKAEGKFSSYFDFEHISIAYIANEKLDPQKLNNFNHNLEYFKNKEFSVIIYDKLAKSLFFATDCFASKPLFYALINDCLYIESDLLRLSQKFDRLELNLDYLNNYLSYAANTMLGYDQTVFKDIFKVLPAGIIKYQAGELSQECYWQPEFSDEVKNKTDDQIYGLFRNKLEKSFLPKTDSVDKVGCELSGGLDSSSISSLTGYFKKQFSTFYWNTKTATTNENHYAQLVADKFKSNHINFDLDFETIFDKQIAITSISAQPNPSLFPNVSLFDMVNYGKDLGLEMICTGKGGDSVVGLGYEYLDELIANKDWSQLKICLKQLAEIRVKKNFTQHYDSDPYQNTLFDILLSDLLSAFKNRKVGLLLNLLTASFFKLDMKFSKLLKLVLSKIIKGKKRAIASPQIIRKEFLLSTTNQMELHPELKTSNKNIKTHFDSNFILNSNRGNEVANALCSKNDMLLSNPFFDKELLELSVSISDRLRFDKGMLRGTIRHAMEDLLPPEIRNRTTKAEASELAYLTTKSLWLEFEKRAADYKNIWKYFDKTVFDKYIEIFMDDDIKLTEKRMHIWTVSKVISFAIWLKIFDFKLK